MLSAAIVISLLSLLVATDPEPTGSSERHPPEPPLRPRRKNADEPASPPDRDELAA